MSILENFRSGLRIVWANKGRSFLTMLGIIIGISSVASLLAIGQGVKDDITQQIKGLGSNLLITFPGKFNTGSSGGLGANSNPGSFIGGNILTKKDIEVIRENDKIENAAPLMLVSATLKHQNKPLPSAIVVGSTPEIEKVTTGFELDKGRYFTDEDSGKNFIVLGGNIAKDIFGEENPIGKKVQLNFAEFEIVGILKYQKTSDLLGSNEFQSICVIPLGTAENLAGATQIHRIIAKVKEAKDIEKTKDELYQAILKNHSGNDDFSILTQEDVLDFLDDILQILTALITAIAAISLIVGGIGIMNIMLVTVTERTQEIGLRKAVGATWLDILRQFLIEAVILSLVGGIIGLALTFGITQIVNLKPLIILLIPCQPL